MGISRNVRSAWWSVLNFNNVNQTYNKDLRNQTFFSSFTGNGIYRYTGNEPNLTSSEYYSIFISKPNEDKIIITVSRFN